MGENTNSFVVFQDHREIYRKFMGNLWRAK
jgi:hypothetical protein